jgi:hypothetical protein
MGFTAFSGQKRKKCLELFLYRTLDILKHYNFISFDRLNGYRCGLCGIIDIKRKGC